MTIRSVPVLVAWFCAGIIGGQSQRAPMPETRIEPCRHCRPVHIHCVGGEAKPQPVAVVINLNSSINAVEWSAPESGDRNWAVTFASNQPCGRKVIDRLSPVCQVTGPAGRYRYEVKLEGCERRGRGVVEVR